MKIRFIRPPTASSYNNAEFQEELIITYARGYFNSIGFFQHDVADFWLCREYKLPDAISDDVDVYVVAVREISGTTQYAIKITQSLVESGKRVVLYGQVGRLARLPEIDGRVERVPHDERLLAAALGLSTDGPSFEGDLSPAPYLSDLDLSPQARRRVRGAIETTRGCQFKCAFCFINHGENYPSRWAVRSARQIVKDVEIYRGLGINHIQFRDSEFIGADTSHYADRITLLESLRDLGDIYLMIYARVDTLEKFNQYDLLYQAGVRHVYLGVESLANGDLRALKKGFVADQVISCVRKLAAAKITMQMNFMTFNRNTSLSSLRETIANLWKLADLPPRYLGVPTFLFSFEADWTGNAEHGLSDQTYLRWMIWRRAQPGDKVLFDSKFEPLIELFRLYDYEVTQKIAELTDARRLADGSDAKQIDSWFSRLWKYSLHVFEIFVDLFEEGEINIEKLPQHIPAVYEILEHQALILPLALREIRTREHGLAIARRIAIGAPTDLEDHGWDDAFSLTNANREYA